MQCMLSVVKSWSPLQRVILCLKSSALLLYYNVLAAICQYDALLDMSLLYYKE